MTCIVGIAENDNVWIGGDSAGVAGYSMQVRADEKVFKKGEFVFGFTSSFRMGNLLRYKLDIPKLYENENVDEYLYGRFIDSVIKCFKDNQYATIKENEVLGGMFLFGFRGGLYFIGSDFQIGKRFINYAAVGCGENIALGCLYGLSFNTGMSPKDRIYQALYAAESFSAGVRSPFQIVSIKDNQ